MLATLPTDTPYVQANSHRVIPLIDVRAPAGGAWVPMQVIEATITYGELRTAPVSTLSATVLIETKDGDELIGEEAPLSIFGSWLRVRQQVYREDSSTFIVPWGFFRVDELTVDRLVGAVTLTCTDALQQVASHGLLTLAQGRVLKTHHFQARLQTLLGTPMATIPTFWGATLIDWGGTADRVVGGVGAQYADDRFEGISSLTAMYAPGWAWFCPAESSLFKIKEIGAEPAAEVKPGVFGNLTYESYSDSVDRRDLFNAVVVTYSKIRTVSGGTKDQTLNMRVVVQYVDTLEEIRSTGPFGTQNRDAVGLDISTEAAAITKGQEAIGRALRYTRDISVQCGPIYGLEPGDRVILTQPDRWRPGHDGMPVGGTLIGATIPLHAEGGAWQLTLRVTSLLDATWSPRPTTSIIDEIASTDDKADWWNLKPRADSKNIALTTEFPRGWGVTGETSTRGGGALVAKATGPVVMTSWYAWDERAGTHRYRAKASVKVSKTQNVRVGIDTDMSGVFWGRAKQIKGGKTGTIGADVDIPANANKLRIQVQFQGDAGGTDTLNSVSMEYATRSKT
jgi:hypothetical protein